jgi:hypothetical protein
MSLGIIPETQDLRARKVKVTLRSAYQGLAVTPEFAPSQRYRRLSGPGMLNRYFNGSLRAKDFDIHRSEESSVETRDTALVPTPVSAQILDRASPE